MAAPDGLSERGAALYAGLTKGQSVTAAQDVLAAEAARLADRLELLDGVLRGDEATWGRIRLPRGDDGDLILVIDGALAEARQQANALRSILATLDALTPKEDGPDDDALSAFFAGIGVSSPVRD